MLKERELRAALIAIAVFHVALGALALVAPHTFFDQIGQYGLRNDHYVGDVGAFYAAIGVAFFVSIREPSWRVPLLALTAIWYGLHALNHAFDIGQARSDARGLSDTLLLALGALLFGYLARAAGRVRQGTPR